MKRGIPVKHETATEGTIFQDRTVLIQADYLVVVAGAAGMAFVDSLIQNADVHVALLASGDRPGCPRIRSVAKEPDVKHWSHATSLYRSRNCSQKISDT